MIDKTSKKVISFIRNCQNETFYTRKGFPSDILPDHFLACIDFLESEGYVSTHRVNTGALISATLTHKGRHQKEFDSIVLKQYLLDKWIDLLALVISVLAFIGAYRNEIISILQQLMQALTE